MNHFCKALILEFEQGSICEKRAGPNRPTRRGMAFAGFKYIFYENRYFWPI